MRIKKSLAFLLFILIFYHFPVNSQWIKDTGIDAPFIEALFVNGNKIYAGSDINLYTRTAGSDIWLSTSPLPVAAGGGISSIYKTGSRLIAGTHAHGIFQSTNDGSTWNTINSGLNQGFKITSFVQRDQMLYCGTLGNAVFKSDLNSNQIQWIPFRDSLPNNTSAWDIHSLYNYNGILFSAAGQNGYVYKNESNSNFWLNIPLVGSGSSGLALWTITAKNDHLVGAASTGFFKSIDEGLTWEYFNPGNGYIDQAKFADFGNKIYASLTKSSFGTLIYSTEDNGETWQFEEGLPGIFAYDFVVFDGRFYLGTFDGLWYKNVEPAEAENNYMNLNFVLYQNYPNPFNPGTSIQYEVSKRQFVSLIVYDVLGNEIAILVNEEKSAGNYKEEFDASKLSSGIYFYKLISCSFAQTKKMILLK